MVTLRSARTPDTPANSNHHNIHKNGRTHQTQTQTKETQKVSRYEQFREERIKENMERMQKLGIFDLSLKLKSISKNTSANRKTPPRLSLWPPPGPPRRSSRLQNMTPISYSEANLLKKSTSLECEYDLLRGGLKPEVYTEEHEKLLGNTEMSWTVFVDGYGPDGSRIYDSVEGKTCHQCRHKTLGHRTHCSKCGIGQFCGDCLYKRYGEHVLETKQNPNWICPICRGICNCYRCRQAKGWPPAGHLYKKISQMGFKSVAHYLIQTRRVGSDLNKTSIPASAKRSLHFSDTEATEEGKEGSFMFENYHHKLVSAKTEDKADKEFKVEKKEEMHFLENKHGANNVTSGFSPDEATPDSIGGRPRQRRRKDNGCGEELIRTYEESLNVKQAVELVPSENEAKTNRSLCSFTNTSADSIAGRLRLRRKR